MKHVAVLMGGWSAEREISLRSGKACADAAERCGYRVTRLDVNRDVAATLRALKPDVALNVLHGRPGEDGTYSWKFDQYVRLWPAYDMTRDAIARLWSGITCPTLLVHGLDSWARPPAEDGRLDYFQNARALPVAGAGHWVHHDQLDVFLREVRAFLRDAR